MLSTEELIDILAESICSHQKSIAQYTFLTDEKHKEIKSAWSEKHEDEAKKKFDEIQEYLYSEFGNVFDEQIGYLRNIFKSTRVSCTDIRACIKIIVAGETILTLYRNPESNFCDAFPFFENTAFASILKLNKKSYFCNDIPQYSRISASFAGKDLTHLQNDSRMVGIGS